MTLSLTARAALLIALCSPAFAGTKPPPWPDKAELRAIQNAAFTCSRKNTAEACDQTRQLVDPLMDHPLLPGVCKDVVWTLLEQAQETPSNDYKRRDAIDQPARRLVKVCAQPSKPKSPAKAAPNTGAAQS